MEFKYTENTTVLIDGGQHQLRFENGITGIGSRMYWINDKKQSRRAVFQSPNITKGNHFIYKIKWRKTPYDWVDIIIHEDHLNILLGDDQKWRKPSKRSITL